MIDCCGMIPYDSNLSCNVYYGELPMPALDIVRSCIRDIPDFPKPGILFKDITPILQNPAAYAEACAYVRSRAEACGATHIGAVESRGFLFGSVAAHELNLPMFPIRKKGKLPAQTIEESYALEYGEATLEVHVDAVAAGDRVLLVDDLLATGGTAAASARLVERLGASVVELTFLVELAFLNGRDALQGYDVEAGIIYR